MNRLDCSGGEESAPGGRKFGESRPIAFSRFLHFARLFWNQTWNNKIKLYSIHNKSTSSPRLVGSYSTCYLYEMLPIQSLLYEMLPRRNVTIRKCTIRNVTDPKIRTLYLKNLVFSARNIFKKNIIVHLNIFLLEMFICTKCSIALIFTEKKVDPHLNYCRLNYWLFELLIVWTIVHSNYW